MVWNKINKIILLLIGIFVLSCTPSIGREDVATDDPQPQGLIPYNPIRIEIINDSLFSTEYDSIDIYYDLLILKPDWSDEKHDSIRIQRDTTSINHYNWWDIITVSGKSIKTNDWVFLCGFNYFGDTLYYYRSVLESYLDAIAVEAEKNYYYVDDDDWDMNRDIYMHPNLKTWHLSGNIKFHKHKI